MLQESELLGTLDKARVDFDKLVAADEAASSLQSKRKEAARADTAAAIAEYDAGMTAVTAKIEVRLHAHAAMSMHSECGYGCASTH